MYWKADYNRHWLINEHGKIIAEVFYSEVVGKWFTLMNKTVVFFNNANAAKDAAENNRQ